MSVKNVEKPLMKFDDILLLHSLRWREPWLLCPCRPRRWRLSKDTPPLSATVSLRWTLFELKFQILVLISISDDDPVIYLQILDTPRGIFSAFSKELISWLWESLWRQSVSHHSCLHYHHTLDWLRLHFLEAIRIVYVTVWPCHHLSARLIGLKL